MSLMSIVFDSIETDLTHKLSYHFTGSIPSFQLVEVHKVKAGCGRSNGFLFYD